MQSEAAMTELSPADTQALIAYARQKFAEERFQLAPGLRPIREALEKLNPKPALISRPRGVFERIGR